MITTSTRTAAALLLVLALASCGNTIRGFGKAASNTVDATEDAAGYLRTKKEKLGHLLDLKRS